MNGVHDLWLGIRAVIVALWNNAGPIAQQGWQQTIRLNNFLRRIVAIAIVALVFPPVAALLAALGGNPGLAAALVFIITLAAALVLLIGFPLLTGVAATIPQGRQVLRFFGLVIAVELLIGIYLAMVPVRNDPSLLPLLAIVVAAAVLLRFLAQGRAARLTFWFLVVIAIGISFIFIGGGREAIKEKSDAKAAPTAPVPTTKGVVLTEERQYIMLLGENKLAGPVDLDALEVGECPKWLGPAGTLVHYENGFEVAVETTSPHPSVGLIYFKGPTGQQAGVRKTTDCN